MGFFGVEEVDLVGVALGDLIEGLDGILAARHSDDFQFEALRAFAMSGEIPVDVRGRIRPIGDLTHGVLSFHDVSNCLAADNRNRRNTELRDESRRLEAIGALSAGISHEINTPIQFIGDNLEFLRESLAQIHASYSHFKALYDRAIADGAYPEEVADIAGFNEFIALDALVEEVFDAASESQAGVAQVREINEAMKEFAHAGVGEHTEADVNAVVRGVATISRNRTKGVAEVELALAPDLPPVACRRGQLQQALVNLVVNAADAVEETRNGGLGNIRIETAREDGFVRISISDTGPGVPASIRKQIFDPFFTTKGVGKGAGQGLAPVKEFIVARQGGEVLLTRRDGFATTFEIRLPLGGIDETISGDGNVRAA